VAPEKAADLPIREHLKILGVSTLNEWDILTFLHRNGTSLTSAAEIALLLGGNKAGVSVTLDQLASVYTGFRFRQIPRAIPALQN
jgi:DNA-binding MarR family transcriptional regulator